MSFEVSGRISKIVCPGRINSMIGTLKCSYPGLSSDTMTDIMDQIQKSIRQKVKAVLVHSLTLYVQPWCSG